MTEVRHEDPRSDVPKTTGSRGVLTHTPRGGWKGQRSNFPRVLDVRLFVVYVKEK